MSTHAHSCMHKQETCLSGCSNIYREQSSHCLCLLVNVWRRVETENAQLPANVRLCYFTVTLSPVKRFHLLICTFSTIQLYFIYS